MATANKTPTPKTRKTYTPSERAVRAVTMLSLRDLAKFCDELSGTDADVALYIADRIQPTIQVPA